MWQHINARLDTKSMVQKSVPAWSGREPACDGEWNFFVVYLQIQQYFAGQGDHLIAQKFKVYF